VDKDKWLYPIIFKEDKTNFNWQCPTCEVGMLKLNADSFILEETEDSKKSRGHEAWEPDWIKKNICGLLKCDNQNCKDIISIIGKIRVDLFDDGEEQTFEEAITPIIIEPAPHIIKIPGKCSKEIRDILKKAFSLYWYDIPSCANKIRNIVELLLDTKKINRKKDVFNKKKDKKIRISIPLHERILLFGAKFGGKEPKMAEVANVLLAIKWIGNDGSHSANNLNKDALLDGFKLLEFVFEELLDERMKKISKIYKTINKHKGPRSKK
jgi:Domain of unknown function (DUF4145)